MNVMLFVIWCIYRILGIIFWFLSAIVSYSFHFFVWKQGAPIVLIQWLISNRTIQTVTSTACQSPMFGQIRRIYCWISMFHYWAIIRPHIVEIVFNIHIACWFIDGYSPYFHMCSPWLVSPSLASCWKSPSRPWTINAIKPRFTGSGGPGLLISSSAQIWARRGGSDNLTSESS